MAFIRRLYGEYAFVMLVLGLGLLASVALSWNYQQSQEEHVRKEFDRAAQERLQIIGKMLNDNKILLNTLTAFYRSDDDMVTPNEFNVFTKQLVKDHPYLEAIEWAPRIRKAERDAYVKKEQAYIPGFKLMEKDADGNLVDAKIREEYFPLYYAQPLKDNERMMGYDIASDADTAPALEAARDTRQVQASNLFREWGKVEGHEGVLFAVPIYREKKAPGADGETYEMMEGFVVTVISMPKLIEAALKPLQPAGINIVIRDISAEGEAQNLYVRSTKMEKFTEAQVLEDLHENKLLKSNGIFEVGGRKWEAVMMAAPGYFTIKTHPGTFAILLGGVFVTALLAFYLISRLREHERISMEVEDRTQEVARQKKRIEMILLSTHEGIVGLDTTGNITFCNPRATALLGYSKRELVGQDHHTLIHHATEDGKPIHKADSVITQVLLDGKICTTSDHVFWRKEGKPFNVEYTASPLFEGDDVTGAVLIFHDITERKGFEQQLSHMARHDQMTGLANRALLSEHLKKALVRAERTHKKVGVIYCDLNDFKPINDKYGHAAGDIILKTFARHLGEVIRESDTAARMGGDEFTIMADGLADRAECYKIIDRLLESLQVPVELDDLKHVITSSIGVAFYPDDAQDADRLITCADAAMYKAKKDKSMKYAVYTANDQMRVHK
jgi:diguanylate cyclase (GGDEF)-like protein/PAS domain S-box-containing protein